MRQLYFRDDENINIRRRPFSLKVERDGFPDVSIQFVHGLPLRKNIFADSAGTPTFTVVVNLNFHQHKRILAFQGAIDQPFQSDRRANHGNTKMSLGNRESCTRFLEFRVKDAQVPREAEPARLRKRLAHTPRNIAKELYFCWWKAY